MGVNTLHRVLYFIPSPTCTYMFLPQTSFVLDPQIFFMSCKKDGQAITIACDSIHSVTLGHFFPHREADEAYHPNLCALGGLSLITVFQNHSSVVVMQLLSFFNLCLHDKPTHM